MTGGLQPIVGEHCHDNDITINPCKTKHLTNMRQTFSDEALTLEPPVRMSLEQCLEYIQDDELLEVTPKALRLRKRILSKTDRVKLDRQKAKAAASNA